MRLISTRNLRAATEAYPNAQTAIESWLQIMKNNDWESLEQIRTGYSRWVDEVYGYTIFNIKHNHYRLIVQINYKTKIIFFKKFSTHSQYNKINWSDRDEVRKKIG